MMTKCYYICMESVNINSHIAVSLFNIQREKGEEGREWTPREVKYCV